MFNTNEAPIKFKYSIFIGSVNYKDTTLLKDQKCNNLLTELGNFIPTINHQMLHKHSFHPKHTFKGLLKYVIVLIKYVLRRRNSI